MTNGTEIILTFSRATFERYFSPSFLYRPLPEDPRDAADLVQDLMSYARPAPRTPELEADESVKQAVAYIVLRRRDETATRFWLYRRASDVGDDRLKGKLSLGVGGHVCEDDWLSHDPPIGLRTLREAASREFAEEVGHTEARISLQGFVNHEGNHVGRCHLGFVSTATLSPGADPLAVPRQGIEPLGWYTASDLYRLQDQGAEFETWSQAVLGSLKSWSLGSSAGFARIAP